MLIFTKSLFQKIFQKDSKNTYLPSK